MLAGHPDWLHPAGRTSRGRRTTPGTRARYPSCRRAVLPSWPSWLGSSPGICRWAPGDHRLSYGQPRNGGRDGIRTDEGLPTPPSTPGETLAQVDDPLKSGSWQELANRYRRPGYGVPVLFALVSLALGIRLFRFIDQYSVNVLFWDQWDFLDGLFQGAGPWTLFTWQHGPPRLGVGYLLIQLVYSLTDWNVRAEAFVAGAIAILTSTLALVLKRRLFARITPWDACIPFIFITTTAGETYAGVPNLAHGPVSQLLVVLLPLALCIRDEKRRVGAVLAINFAAIYTGFAFFVGLIAPLLLAIDAVSVWREPRRRNLCLGAIIVALGSLASFAVGYHFFPAADCLHFPHRRPLEYFPFVGLLFSRPLGLTGAGIGRIAPAILFSFYVTLVSVWALVRTIRAKDRAPLDQTIFFLTAFSLLFAVTAAIGRVCLGVSAASSTRYIPYILPSFLGMYFALLSWKLPSTTRAALLSVFVVVAASKEFAFRDENLALVRYYSAGKISWRDCYLHTLSVERCAVEVRFPIYPHPSTTRLPEKLDYLRQRRLNLFGETSARRGGASLVP